MQDGSNRSEVKKPPFPPTKFTYKSEFAMGPFRNYLLFSYDNRELRKNQDIMVVLRESSSGLQVWSCMQIR